jgi:hypothetical protein
MANAVVNAAASSQCQLALLMIALGYPSANRGQPGTSATCEDRLQVPTKTVAHCGKTAYFRRRLKSAAEIPVIGETMQMGELARPVLVKRYAGRRLYGPATGAYLTRDDLMMMAENGEKFVVIDIDTGDDVTHSYHPIIVEH